MHTRRSHLYLCLCSLMLMLGGKSFPTALSCVDVLLSSRGSKLNCLTISGDGDYFQRQERLTAAVFFLL
jgi:hypothetical protein